jgi:hypothetical protein
MTDIPVEELRRRKKSGRRQGGHVPNGHDTGKQKFNLVPFDKINVVPFNNYLVKGQIPREGLVVVWGPPKCGKSFWTFDLAMHIANAIDYRGSRVKPGLVIYIACEGERGLAGRVEAFRRRNMSEDIGEVPFLLLTTRLDLVGEVEQLVRDIENQLGGKLCAAIIVDTLNRSIRGSESDDVDMGLYVAAADKVRVAFHCSVIIVHHCGTNDQRPRGHTSLTAAADAQIAVKRDDAGRIKTVVEWMKDGPEGAKTTSTLEVVEVGLDEDGEPITSCVVVAAEADGSDAPEKPKWRPTGQTLLALDALKNALVDSGQVAPQRTTIPTVTTRVVTLENWRHRCERSGLVDGNATGSAFRKAFHTVKFKLRDRSLVGFDGDFVWLISD